MTRLVLPGVLPSVNHQYRNVTISGRRIRVLTAAAKKWEQSIIDQTSAYMGRIGWSTQETKTIVRLWYFWPDKRKRDTHNTLKLLLDCFEAAGVYKNDHLALPQIMDYQIDRENPRVEIEFEVTA